MPNIEPELVYEEIQPMKLPKVSVPLYEVDFLEGSDL